MSNPRLPDRASLEYLKKLAKEHHAILRRLPMWVQRTRANAYERYVNWGMLSFGKAQLMLNIPLNDLLKSRQFKTLKATLAAEPGDEGVHFRGSKCVPTLQSPASFYQSQIENSIVLTPFVW
jgi:hypothetical protein